jgi:hypothetical protein
MPYVGSYQDGASRRSGRNGRPPRDTWTDEQVWAAELAVLATEMDRQRRIAVTAVRRYDAALRGERRADGKAIRIATAQRHADDALRHYHEARSNYRVKLVRMLAAFDAKAQPHDP